MGSEEIVWPLPPHNLSLGAVDVHVWAACLDAPVGIISRCASLLPPDEKERAARFRFDKHRNRFIVGRAILRSVLGQHLNCPPEQLRFVHGSHGKPALASELGSGGLHFNLAHSEDIALLAVSRVGPIGVDVEQVRPMTDADELVERFFSARENALFQELAENQKSTAFFNLWTRKEAWLKAIGEGIAHSLNRVEVTFLPDEPARLLALPNESGSNSDWALRELAPARGVVGAIAVPNLQFSLCTFHLPISELL
jgi:4'-phosphopantetheinyl transferase